MSYEERKDERKACMQRQPVLGVAIVTHHWNPIPPPQLPIHDLHSSTMAHDLHASNTKADWASTTEADRASNAVASMLIWDRGRQSFRV